PGQHGRVGGGKSGDAVEAAGPGGAAIHGDLDALPRYAGGAEEHDPWRHEIAQAPAQTRVPALFHIDAVVCCAGGRNDDGGSARNARDRAGSVAEPHVDLGSDDPARRDLPVGADARHERMKKLREIITRRFPRRCVCLSIRSPAKRNLGSEGIPVEVHADVLARRTPWIALLHCRDCGTDWLIGIDTLDDDYYLHRLTPEGYHGARSLACAV